MTDATETAARATLGALVENRSSRARVFRSDVRVGDYAFDSSRFIAGGLGGAMGSIALLPTDDDELAMRRQAWLTTDSTYKNAVQVFSRKKAAFANRNDPDPIPDLLPGGAGRARRAGAGPGSGPGRLGRCGAGDLAAVRASRGRRVGRDAGPRRRHALLREQRGDAHGGARAGGDVQGQRHDAGRRRHGRPRRGDAGRASGGRCRRARSCWRRRRRMLEDLLRTRSARVGDDYSGPVLVEHEAAATLVSQAFVSFFLARRTPDSDDPRGEGMSQAGVTPFLTRIGNRVLPESFTVKDTPSMTRFGALPVGGAYVVDDEGVMAQDVTLVEGGRLRTLLTSRTPQRNLPSSNGHARGGGPQAGVFQIECAEAIPAAELKAKYLATAEDAGPPVRLHPAPARRAGRARHDAGGVGGEGDAGRQGRAGPGADAEQCHPHDIPRHPGGVAPSGRC